MHLKKVVITGTGAVSPYGISVPVFIDGLASNKSAVINLENEWADTINDLNSWVCAKIPCSLNENSIPRKYRKTMGRIAIIAYISALEAL